jgi:hypothetical protein
LSKVRPGEKKVRTERGVCLGQGRALDNGVPVWRGHLQHHELETAVEGPRGQRVEQPEPRRLGPRRVLRAVLNEKISRPQPKCRKKETGPRARRKIFAR